MVFLLSAGAPALAQATRYVTDQLEVDMRTGESTQHRIVAMLRSGTRVQVLEDNPETGWSRVRTEQGAEGWVLTRFLENTPSARERLARADQEIARHNATIRDLTEKQRSATGDAGELRRQVEELTRTNQTQEQELNRIRRTSANAIALDEENRTLKEQLGRLERDHQMLQQQNEVLRDSTSRDWFIVGAGVVLLGIIIGLIIPKIRWKRKSAWNRF